MYIIARYGDSSGWGNIAGYRDRRDGRGVVVGEAGVELAQATALHPGNQVLSSLSHYHHPTIIVIAAEPGKALSYLYQHQYCCERLKLVNHLNSKIIPYMLGT